MKKKLFKRKKQIYSVTLIKCPPIFNIFVLRILASDNTKSSFRQYEV